MLTLDEVKQEIEKVFYFFNGVINPINHNLKLEIVYDPGNYYNAYGSYLFPRTIRVYPWMIMQTNIFHEDNNDNSIRNIILLCIIHELYHADQNDYLTDPLYKRQLEFDAEFMTYTFVLHHIGAIRIEFPYVNANYFGYCLSALQEENPDLCIKYSRITVPDVIVRMAMDFSMEEDSDLVINIVQFISWLYIQPYFYIEMNISGDKLVITEKNIGNTTFDYLFDFCEAHRFNEDSKFSYVIKSDSRHNKFLLEVNNRIMNNKPIIITD